MKWIIFDLGKTLITDNPERKVKADINAANWISLKFGINISPETLAEKRRQALQKSRLKFWGNEKRHDPNILFEFLLEELGLNKSSGGEEYWRHYNNVAELMPNAREILEYLKDKYQLGLISNGGKENILRVLKRLDIEKYFDDIISSEEHGEKSTLKPFKKFLERNSADAKECIMIGDRKDEDMYAKKLGIKTVLFTREASHYGHAIEPDYVINDLLELKKLV